MPQVNSIAVSKALDVEPDPASQPLLEAIAAIDSVHTDGMLPLISVKRVFLTDGHGQYVTQQPGHAAAIRISHFTDHAEMTLIHEVGHFLDFHGLGTGGEAASRMGEVLQRWRNAIKDSQAVQELGHLWKSSTSMIKVRQPGDSVVEYPISQRYVQYLLLPEELWARNYAQFVAVKSGNDDLRHQLDRSRDRPARAFYYPAQWDESDFAPIMAEMQAVFQQKGWIK